MTNALPTARRANISFVTPQLAVGGDLSYDARTAAGQLAELVALGVSHIIDVRMEWSDEQAFADHAPAIGYLYLGIDDAGQQIPFAFFDESVGYALEALRDPNAIVLTHCHMGINRGPSLGFAVLLALGWDAVDALAAIRAARPIAVIWYAERALAWHHDRTATPPAERERQMAAVATWRRHNHLDVARVIRQVRLAEAAGY